MWEYSTLTKGTGKEDSGRCAGKARRKTRSVAASVSFHGYSGASQKKKRHGLLSPNDAQRLYRNEGWQLGKFQRRMQKKRNRQNGPSGEHAKLTRKWREMKLDVWVLCRKSPGGVPISRDGNLRQSVNGKSHLVVRLSLLQQFSFGKLHLVGIDRTPTSFLRTRL